MEKYFFEAFEDMERLGPGSEELTLKAIECIDQSVTVKILDIGCGVGTHTFLIAKALENAEIIAIDNSQNYIDKLNSKAKEYNLSHRVTGICMSMFEMTFDDNSFDYIFAEGAIYIAGFTNGLADWKRYLKREGMIICSEISWITDTPSKVVEQFWTETYPQIDTIKNKISQAENLAYQLVNHFVLPKECWTDNYYVPLQNNINTMKLEYADNKIALEVVDAIQQEIDIYTQYGDEYSYVFYTLQVK